MKRLVIMSIVGVLTAGLSFPAFAQSQEATEVGTAHAHALMAQSASTLPLAHTHLHHVINCLVGPKGSGFDAAAGTPCEGQGNGALNDSQNDSALHAKLTAALADAESGLKSNSLETVQQDAAKIAAELGATTSQKPSGSHTR